MNSREEIYASRALGALSVGSGALMLLFPEGMSRLFALPQKPSLIRGLGLRDICIGLAQLDEQRHWWGNLSRGVSDLIDLTLMLAEVRRNGRATTEVLGRAAATLGSASMSLSLALQGFARRAASTPRYA